MFIVLFFPSFSGNCTQFLYISMLEFSGQIRVVIWLWPGFAPAKSLPPARRHCCNAIKANTDFVLASKQLEFFGSLFFPLPAGPRRQSASRKWLRWKDFWLASVFGKPNIWLRCSLSKTLAISEISAQLWLFFWYFSPVHMKTVRPSEFKTKEHHNIIQRENIAAALYIQDCYETASCCFQNHILLEAN